MDFNAGRSITQICSSSAFINMRDLTASLSRLCCGETMRTARQIEVGLRISAELADLLLPLDRQNLSCAVGCGSWPGKGDGVICQRTDAQTCLLYGRGAK